MDEIMAIITGSGEEEVEEHITDDSFMKKVKFLTNFFDIHLCSK